MRVFEKLSKTHVNIDNGDGTYFSCPMLPISRLPAYKAIMEKMDNAASVDEKIAGRDQLLALCREVFPPEKHDILERFDIIDAMDLATYLMYGFGDSEPGDDQKKTVYPSRKMNRKTATGKKRAN
ncbi:MAG: hypothetical protein PHV59_09305 [Victivallales bacterium]|nr:hypothetical protein [Victivallales bacterium]